MYEEITVSIPYQQVNKCYSGNAYTGYDDLYEFQSLISRSINVTEGTSTILSNSNKFQSLISRSINVTLIFLYLIY